MRDYVNPLVLLAVVVLLACRVGGVGDAVTWEVWLLTLCVTAFIADAALAVAKSMTHRRPLMNCVWAIVFLIVGCCSWLMSGSDVEADEEVAAFRLLQQAYRQGADPLAVDAEGDSFFLLAASLGREKELVEVLNGRAVAPELLAEAACRAAERGHKGVLRTLFAAGAVLNTDVLCAAVQGGKDETVKMLLEQGADPNAADSDGTPPLVHAALADSAPVVKLLLQAGADAGRTDASGRDAAGYARSNKVADLLPAPAQE